MNKILKKIENKEYLNTEQVQVVRDNLLKIVRYFHAESVSIIDYDKGYKIDINDNIYFNLNSDDLDEVGLEVLY